MWSIIKRLLKAVWGKLGSWGSALVNAAKKGWTWFKNFWTNTVPSWVKRTLNAIATLWEIYRFIVETFL